MIQVVKTEIVPKSSCQIRKKKKEYKNNPRHTEIRGLFRAILQS
jgi:hypothetical protein